VRKLFHENSVALLCAPGMGLYRMARAIPFTSFYVKSYACKAGGVYLQCKGLRLYVGCCHWSEWIV